jgi:hypothetical protein
MDKMPLAVQWTLEWPTEPGWYWFYGYTHKCQRSAPPRLDVGQVFRMGGNGSKSLAHVVHGEFVYRAEGAVGWWASMDLPTNLPADVPDA